MFYYLYYLFIGFIIVIVKNTYLDIKPPIYKDFNDFNIDVSEEILAPEMVEFIYDNAVRYLEDTRISIKIISDRGIYLLSYLLIIIGFLIANILTDLKSNHFNVISNICIGIIFYYGYISYYLVRHMKPKFAHTTSTQPKNLFRIGTYNLYDVKLIRSIEIQRNIIYNALRVDEMNLYLSNAIDAAFIIPLIKYYLWKFPKILFFFGSNNRN